MTQQDEMEAALAGVGGPGPEDEANGRAALAAALTREAATLARARQVDPDRMPNTGELDFAVLRGVVARAGRRQVLALALGQALTDGGDTAAVAARCAAFVAALGCGAQDAAALLRAAALALPTDDAAARIAAAILSQDLARRLDAATAG